MRLDQLWWHLPATRQQAIGLALAQMIARQIQALPSSVRKQKEERDE